MKRPPHLLLFGIGPGHYSRRGLHMFILTYLGAFLFAGAAAYPVYEMFQWLGADAAEGSFPAWLADQRLSRIADRLRLLAAAGGTIWLVGYAGLWGNFGFLRSRSVSQFTIWAGLGFAMLLLPVSLQLLLGSAAPRPDVDWSRFAEVLAAGIATACIVAFLEESIFRGMLLRLFTTAMASWPAILLSAVVFAAVHFKSVKWMPPADASWIEAWRIAGAGLLAPVFMFDAMTFANLLLAGIVLNLLFWRSANLVPCFGLHAGWVFAQRLSLGFLQPVEGAGNAWIGSPRVTDGLLALVLLGAFSIWLMRDQIHVRAPELDPATPA